MFKQPVKLSYDNHNLKQQKQLLAEAFADLKWETPGLLERLGAADDLYFDHVSQIRMGAWSQGRVTLAGDAAHCPALLTGQGSTLAMIGAYTLAGELQATQGDHRLAFQQYEQTLRPLIHKEQKKVKSGAHFLVPSTPLSLWTRNHLSPVLYPFIVIPGGIWKKFLPQSNMLKDYVS